MTPTRRPAEPRVSSTKTAMFATACGAFVASCIWLVISIAVAAPVRIGFAAVMSVVLTAGMAVFMRHEMDLDRVPQAFAPPPTDDDWEKGES